MADDEPTAASMSDVRLVARAVAEQVLDEGYPFPREHRWWADTAEELARYVLVFVDELEASNV